MPVWYVNGQLLFIILFLFGKFENKLYKENPIINLQASVP